jgi:hypothetical protein
MVDKIEQLNLEILEAYTRIRKVVDDLPDMKDCNDPLFLAGKMLGEISALESILSRIKVLNGIKNS